MLANANSPHSFDRARPNATCSLAPRCPSPRPVSLAQNAEKARRILLGEILLRRRNTQWAMGILHTVHECFSFRLPRGKGTSPRPNTIQIPRCGSTFHLMSGPIDSRLLARRTTMARLYSGIVVALLTPSPAISCETRDKEIAANVRTLNQSCLYSYVEIYFFENIGKRPLHSKRKFSGPTLLTIMEVVIET